MKRFWFQEGGFSMFYIRADANKEIATGHVMRCLSIAEELKRQNIAVTFITADHNADELICSRGFQTICLDSKWNALESELVKLKKLITENNIEKILVDTYFVTDKYLEELSKLTKVIYIDDLGLIRYPVYKIINYSLYGKEMDYCRQTGCQPSALLLGTKYVPLREEFHNIVPVFRQKVQGIFISTGGADKYNIAGVLLERLIQEKRYKEIQFHVISGKMNVNLSKLLEIEEKAENVTIHSDVQKMSQVMQQCDLAISGCGSTMYELCSCGLPILTFSFADNQKQGTDAFEKAGAAVNCGDVREGMEAFVNRVITSLELLTEDAMLRKGMCEKARGLVDGQGVERLVKAMSMYKGIMDK